MFGKFGEAFKASWSGDMEKIANLIVKAETFAQARTVALGAALGNAAFYGAFVAGVLAVAAAIAAPAVLALRHLFAS